jgi:hypothetical protein
MYKNLFFTVGFLASVTQDMISGPQYRGHVYRYGYDGQLLGVLPCLGPGPRSCCPVHLDGNPALTDSDTHIGKPGWHVYLRDGHEGIVGIRVTDR